MMKMMPMFVSKYKKSFILYINIYIICYTLLLIIAVFELVESAPCRSVINKISENIENIENTKPSNKNCC